MRSGGEISFADFMEIALYQPALGYYSGGLQKFGEKGDFITAPEVSPLFGQCLANQVRDILLGFDGGAAASVLIEFGAGSGVLMVELLLALDALDALPGTCFIVELSAELQSRQRHLLMDKVPHLADRVVWLDHLPDNVSQAVVIANEVLDAMPVDVFRVQEDEVETLCIGCDESGMIRRFEPAGEALKSKLNSIRQRSEIDFSEGYTSEFNHSLGPWLAALDAAVDTMILLAIDYGYNEREYYHPDRHQGTMMCYYRHRAHDDFFWWPGLQDITAFVNFTDVAYEAVALGMDVAGYTTQAAFLLANGLAELHAQQVTDDVAQQVSLSQQVKTLTLPSEMGDRFKVIALSKNYAEPLQGFSMLDLRNRL